LQGEWPESEPPPGGIRVPSAPPPLFRPAVSKFEGRTPPNCLKFALRGPNGVTCRVNGPKVNLRQGGSGGQAPPPPLFGPAVSTFEGRTPAWAPTCADFVKVCAKNKMKQFCLCINLESDSLVDELSVGTSSTNHLSLSTNLM
jgi:hypothetical protein